jgi:uncharacterized protein (DUF2164 family)
MEFSSLRSNAVSRNWSERKVAWLIAGVGLGMALATWWPHEPQAYADATAVAGNKFAMCTVQTTVGNADAIFILDYATGRLMGAVYNNQSGAFSQPLIRNIAQDFEIRQKGDYVMVTGYVGAQSQGGQPAAGGIYVAELTTGKLVLYGFVNVQQGNAAPQELSVLGMFPWRAAG